MMHAKLDHLAHLLTCHKNGTCNDLTEIQRVNTNIERKNHTILFGKMEAIYCLLLLFNGLFSLTMALGNLSRIYSITSIKINMNRYKFYLFKYFIPLLIIALIINLSTYNMYTLKNSKIQYWWDLRFLVSKLFIFLSVDEEEMPPEINIIDLALYALIIMYIRLIIFSVLISQIQYDMRQKIELRCEDFTLTAEEEKKMTFLYFCDILIFNDWRKVENRLSDVFLSAKQLNKNTQAWPIQPKGSAHAAARKSSVSSKALQSASAAVKAEAL